jgi:poly(A) polymerase
VIFQIQQFEKDIFKIVSEAAKELGFPTYVVGGYVRDRILGRPSKDMDIVCVGNGIQLAEAVANRLTPKPHIAVFTRFGTAMLRHKDLEIEFVGARRESYREDSRKPTVEEGSLEDDQNRRDFTINALAISLNDHNFGEIIDSFGGIKHLEMKHLETPLHPDKTFSDDPLRMMRGIRFACQLGFTLSEETLVSIHRNRERIQIISKERIITEMEKMMACPKPSIGFALLYSTGLLKIIFPEMAALAGAENVEGIGHKDNFTHTLQVIDNICQHTQEIYLRWAALFHDIGKPATKRFEKGLGWTFHGHPEVGASMLPRLCRNLGLPTDQRLKYMQKLVRLHHRPMALPKEEVTDSAIRRLLFDAGDDIEDLMMLCEADITSKSPTMVRRYMLNYVVVRERLKEVEEKDQIRNWQPPVTGEIIMETFDLKPGKEVGILKNAIREAILDGVITNEYESAYNFLLAQGALIGLEKVSKNDTSN